MASRCSGRPIKHSIVKNKDTYYADGRPRWKAVKATDEIDWEEIEKRDRQMLDTYYRCEMVVFMI